MKSKEIENIEELVNCEAELYDDLAAACASYIEEMNKVSVNSEDVHRIKRLSVYLAGILEIFYRRRAITLDDLKDGKSVAKILKERGEHLEGMYKIVRRDWEKL